MTAQPIPWQQLILIAKRHDYTGATPDAPEKLTDDDALAFAEALTLAVTRTPTEWTRTPVGAREYIDKCRAGEIEVG